VATVEGTERFLLIWLYFRLNYIRDCSVQRSRLKSSAEQPSYSITY